jgi:hypothetical protein
MALRKELVLAREEMLAWIGRLGAVTAEALAERDGCTREAACSRLNAAARAGLLLSARPLQGRPALYTATADGLRAAGLERLEPGCVSAANAAHAIACVDVAVTLEDAYPDHRVVGERGLRGEESDGVALASAILDRRADGSQVLHRPDLVLWPISQKRGAEAPWPVAVEVELTVKAPDRLVEICRAWADSDCVASTLYFAAPEVLRPLRRAVEKADADEWIVVLDLEAVLGQAIRS